MIIIIKLKFNQPHNILVGTLENGEINVKIADLGSSIRLESHSQYLTEPCGTAGYIGHYCF
jgi:serine/threonine protein kinase